MTKFSATFPILCTAKSSECRKGKESSAKANRRRIHTAEARKKRASCIFGGSPIDNEYDPLIYMASSNLKGLIMKLLHCLHLQQIKLVKRSSELQKLCWRI